MGLDADLFISKTYRVFPGEQKSDVTFSETAFAKVGTCDFWSMAIQYPLEDVPLDCRYKREETLFVLGLGKAWGIYPFLEQLLGEKVDHGKVSIPDDLVLPMLYQLHDDCVNRKVYPGSVCEGPWLNVHGEMESIRRFIETIIETEGPERKFKPEWEGFDWHWDLSY